MFPSTAAAQCADGIIWQRYYSDALAIITPNQVIFFMNVIALADGNRNNGPSSCGHGCLHCIFPQLVDHPIWGDRAAT